MIIIKDKWNRGTDKPYDMVLRKVREDLRISGDAYRLYVTLYNSNTDPKVGKVFTPTTESLASQFKVNNTTIKRWLRELKHYGYISIIGSKEVGYVMYVNKESKGIFTVDGGKNAPIKNKEMGAKMHPSMGANMTPIIKTNAAPTGGAAFANKDYQKKEEKKIENVQLDLNSVTHSPTAATPSGQPSEMLQSSMCVGETEEEYWNRCLPW
jgi:hypothetical protein